MKTIKGKGSKISQRPVAVRGHELGGVLPNGGSASPGFPCDQTAPLPGKVPVLDGGRVRMPGAKRRRSTSTKFHLPAATQRAIVRLPEVRDWWIARERQLQIETAIKLIAGGISLNRTAKILGVPASWLSVTIPRYQRDGFAALLPQMRGRVGRKPAVGKRSQPAPCVLHLYLMP